MTTRPRCRDRYLVALWIAILAFTAHATFLLGHALAYQG